MSRYLHSTLITCTLTDSSKPCFDVRTVVKTSTGVGNDGNINLLTGTVSIKDSSVIFNSNNGGKGNAGDIRINASGDICLRNESQINAATFGTGSAGNTTINSGGTVLLNSTGSDTVNTGIYSAVGNNAGKVGTGIGGNINLNARNLFLNRAAKIS